MISDFREQLDVFTHGATESEVRLSVCDMSRGRIRAFHGEIRGPRCNKAKTLQASFAVARCDCTAEVSNSTSVLVTEPCYWAPELPMLYDLTLEMELADGTKTTWRQPVGLRRWEIHGRNFFRDGKRVVLRGVAIDEPTPAQLKEAEAAELALMVRGPSTDVLRQASDWGVPLVVELRELAGELTPAMLRLTWHPAVAVVLLGEGETGGFYQPQAMKLGALCCPAKPQAADVVACELAPSERPTAEAATCDRPVIAIRRGGTYPELAAARHGCDRLQAELSPEFDLAGYFV